jgi:hypothetical protein
VFSRWALEHAGDVYDYAHDDVLRRASVRAGGIGA